MDPTKAKEPADMLINLSLSRPIKSSATNGTPDKVPDKDLQAENDKIQQNQDLPDIKIRYFASHKAVPTDDSPHRMQSPRIQITKRQEKKHRSYPTRHNLRNNDTVRSGWIIDSPLLRRKAPVPLKNSKKREQQICAAYFDPIDYYYCYKIFLLVTAWLFCLIMFIVFDEHRSPLLHSSFLGSEKKIDFDPRTDYQVRVLVELSGPFKSVHRQHKVRYPLTNNLIGEWKDTMLSIKLARDYDEGDAERETSEDEFIFITKGRRVDFNVGELRYAYLYFKASPRLPKEGVDDKLTAKVYGIRISLIPNSTDTLIPFAIRWSVNYTPIWLRVLCAFLIMLFLYILLLIDLNRTLALIFTSTFGLAIMSILEMRPTFYEVASWLDIEPIMVGFSLMLLSGVAAETGFYDVIGVILFKITDGEIYPFVVLMCTATGIMTFILSNFVTMIFMTPIVIRTSEILDDNMDPVPVLLSMLMISNICGVGTPMGSLASMFIARNEWVREDNFSYWIFVKHMIPAVILACVLTTLYLVWLFIRILPDDLISNSDEKPYRELGLWKHLSGAIPNVSLYWHMIKEEVDNHVNISKRIIARKPKEVEKRVRRKPTDLSEYQIVNWCLLLKALAATVVAIVLIVLHSSKMEPFTHVTLGWSCLCAGILLLIMMNRQELEPVLHRVSWCTLVSLAALAVITQIVYQLTYHAESWKKWYAKRAYEGLYFPNLVILLMWFWVIGLCSAFFNDLLVVTALLHTMLSFGSDFYLQAPVSTFIAALAIGAGFGANGCLLGSAANIVTVDMANQQGYKITVVRFLLFGSPIMFGTLLVGFLYIIVHYFIYK